MPNIVLNIADISGTTILDDGIKIHWTEGRASKVAIEYPEGLTEWAYADGSGATTRAAETLARMDAIENGAGYDLCRQATPIEIDQWHHARNNLGLPTAHSADEDEDEDEDETD